MLREVWALPLHSLASINGQHAPCRGFRQAVLSSPEKLALINAQSSSTLPNQIMRIEPKTVSATSPGVANRLRRAHAARPTELAGAGRDGFGVHSAMRTPHQRNARIVPIHDERSEQAER